MAAAVRTNRPAPMMAPMPSAISCQGPSVRLSVPSPVARDSASRRSMDLTRNMAFELATSSPRNVEFRRISRRGVKARRLYPQILPDSGGRIAGRQQIRDHGHTRGAGLDDRKRIVEGDAADGDHGPAAGGKRGFPHHAKTDRAVAGVFRGGAEDGPY